MENKELSQYVNIVYDEDVEMSVLGSILCFRMAFDDVREYLSDECFSNQFHKDVYSAIISLSDRGDPIDVMTVFTELQRIGKSDSESLLKLNKITSSCSMSYQHNAAVLNDFRARNRAYLSGQKLIVEAKDLTFDISDVVENANKTLSDVFSIPSSGILTMEEAAVSLYEDHIKKNLSGGNVLTGSPTGFRQFDSKSGGFQGGSLIIVAGETSQGKTSLAMSMVINSAKAGFPIAFYSMEMQTTELFARMIAGETGISSSKYLYGQLSSEELAVFDSSIKKMVDLPVYFDDNSTSNIDVIISSIRVMYAKKGIKGAVVDYLQILNVNMRGVNKEQQMGDVSRRLKNLAKDLGIWIIALSQLSRDNTSHIPTLGRLRDSGQISEAADIVMLLYRPEVYGTGYPGIFKSASTNGTAMIDVAKGRNIGRMKFIVGFDANTTKFYELESIPEVYEEEDKNPF